LLKNFTIFGHQNPGSGSGTGSGSATTATSLFCFMPCAGREDAVVAMDEGGSGSFTIPILSSQLEEKISYKSPFNNTYTVQSKCKWFLQLVFSNIRIIISTTRNTFGPIRIRKFPIRIQQNIMPLEITFKKLQNCRD
jgi:hypothetical protein